MTEAQPPRAEPREIVELRRLKDEQPDLASAVDLQIELLQLQRRVQARVPLPSIRLDSDYLAGQLAAGSLLRFEHLKIDWSDVRFLVRASAGAMRTHEALEPDDLRKVEIITRDAERLPFVVRAWYEGTGPGGALPAEVAGLETVLLQAMRPFLTRAADAIIARVDLPGGCTGLSGLRRRTRPRGHHAGRRSPADLQPLHWRAGGSIRSTCPFCRNAERSQITSFTSRDGRYRLNGCDVCERYLKAYDARRATRPVMPAVDSVATLPLDAAAMQRGYNS